MSKNEIYTVRSLDDNNWTVHKNTADFDKAEGTGSYTVTRTPITDNRFMWTCTCFAGSKDTCRHRKMVPLFISQGLVNSNTYYHFDKDKWIEPPKGS